MYKKNVLCEFQIKNVLCEFQIKNVLCEFKLKEIKSNYINNIILNVHLI